jgi:hypothetical protein
MYRLPLVSVAISTTSSILADPLSAMLPPLFPHCQEVCAVQGTFKKIKQMMSHCVKKHFIPDSLVGLVENNHSGNAAMVLRD